MNAKLLVQSLKASKAQVLIAFLFARAALDILELKEWTGLKRETIYDACASLEAMGLLGKQTLAHGRTLWVPAGDMLPLFQMSEKRTPELSPTTATDSSVLIQEIKSVVVVEGQMSGKRTPGEDVIYESLDASFDKNMAACRRVGIGEPKRTHISLMPHVTPRLILDHVRSLTEGETIGLAICRIEADEVPRAWVDEISQRQQDDEQDPKSWY